MPSIFSANQKAKTSFGDFTRRGFARWLIIGFAILVLLNALIVLLAMIKSRDTLSELSGDHREALLTIAELQSKSNDAIQEAFAYILSGELVEKKEFEIWEEAFDLQMNDLESMQGFAERKELVDRVNVSKNGLTETARKSFVEFETSGRISNETFHDWERKIDKLGEHFVELQLFEQDRYDEAQAAATSILKEANVQIPILGAIFFLISACLFGLLYWSIRRYANEQELIRRQLAEQESRHRTYLDCLPELVWVSGQDKGVTYFNKSFLDFTGRPLEEVIGHGWADSIHPDDRDVVQAIYLTSFDARETFNVEFRMRFHDGSFRWIVATGTPMFVNDDREFIGYVGGCVDITEQKQAKVIIEQQHERVAEELNKAKDELVVKTRLAAIGQMSAQIAHELRNPLGAVNNAVFYLKRHVPSEEKKWTEYLELIDDEIKTCNGFIGDLLDVTREKVPNRELTNLSQMIDRAIGQQDIPDNVEVQVKCQPDPFEAYVDRTQISQVINNLLNNALDALGKAGGSIAICVHNNEEDDIITFEDSGVGISSDDESSVFDVLFTTKPTGTGLGLTICKQIVENHGGIIRLVNDSSATKFEVRLPRQVLSNC